MKRPVAEVLNVGPGRALVFLLPPRHRFGASLVKGKRMSVDHFGQIRAQRMKVFSFIIGAGTIAPVAVSLSLDVFMSFTFLRLMFLFLTIYTIIL